MHTLLCRGRSWCSWGKSWSFKETSEGLQPELSISPRFREFDAAFFWSIGPQKPTVKGRANRKKRSQKTKGIQRCSREKCVMSAVCSCWLYGCCWRGKHTQHKHTYKQHRETHKTHGKVGVENATKEKAEKPQSNLSLKKRLNKAGTKPFAARAFPRGAGNLHAKQIRG